MHRELIRTDTFIRAARRYVKKHPQSGEVVEATLQMMSDDVFQPRLKTHKLKGNLDGVWASSAGYDLRVLFEFAQHEGTEAILLLTIGTHDEVY